MFSFRSNSSKTKQATPQEDRYDIKRIVVCVDGTWYDADGKEGECLRRPRSRRFLELSWLLSAKTRRDLTRIDTYRKRNWKCQQYVQSLRFGQARHVRAEWQDYQAGAVTAFALRSAAHLTSTCPQVSRYFHGIGVKVGPYDRYNDAIRGEGCKELIREVYQVRTSQSRPLKHLK